MDFLRIGRGININTMELDKGSRITTVNDGLIIETEGSMNIKDSGERKKFESGAVRDISTGKGRCDLLPLDIVGHPLLLDCEELKKIEEFKVRKDIDCLFDVIHMFAERIDTDVATLLLEVSIHYEDGASKYGENNWKRGIPLHCYLDSGVRHFLKFLRGDHDEPHNRAFVWNMLGAIWTFTHFPELDDVQKDISTDNKNAEHTKTTRHKQLSVGTPPNNDNFTPIDNTEEAVHDYCTKGGLYAYPMKLQQLAVSYKDLVLLRAGMLLATNNGDDATILVMRNDDAIIDEEGIK